MNSKEVVELGITLCQTSRLGLVSFIRENMNPLVLEAMALSNPEVELKLPYTLVEKDPPVVATLKQTINQLYYIEKQLQSLHSLLSTDFSKIQNKPKLLKFVLGALDLADNSTKLLESIGGVGNIANDFSRPVTELLGLKIEDLRKMSFDPSSLRQQVQSRFEQLSLSSLNAEGLVDHAKSLAKIFPEKMARLGDEVLEIGHSLLVDTPHALNLITQHWASLRALELEGGLKQGVLTEPYAAKLFDLIPKSLDTQKEGDLRGMIGQAIADGYTRSKEVADGYMKSAQEAQVNELVARQFFSLVDRLPSSWEELRKSGARDDKKFQLLLNCYQQIRSELAQMNPDLDHAFVTLIQGGELSENEKTWSLHDFLAYRDKLIKRYQSEAKGAHFSYQSYQENLSQSERDTLPKKLLTKTELHDAAKSKLDKKQSKEDIPHRDPSYIPAPKPVSWIDDKQKIAVAINGIQKQRALLLETVPGLRSETSPYVGRNGESAFIKTTKSALNVLHYSEKLLTAHHQGLVASSQTGIKASIKYLLYRVKSAFFARKTASSMMNLTRTLDKEGSTCVSDVCSAAIKFASENLETVLSQRTTQQFQKMKQLVLDIRAHAADKPAPQAAEADDRDSFQA